MKSIKLFIALIAAGLIGCSKQHVTAPAETSLQSKTITVEVVHPEYHDFQSTLELTGLAKANQTTKLYALTPGFLQTIRVDLGSHVLKNEIIAILDNPEIIQQKAEADADLTLKNADYQRVAALFKKSPPLVSPQDVETAEANLEMAKARFKSLASQVGYLTVRAPFAGIVTARYLDRGALVASGLSNSAAIPIVEIMQTDPIRIEVEIPELDASNLMGKARATIKFPALSNAKYEATVSRSNASFAAAFKTLRVQIDLKNPHGVIQPGMYATVSFAIPNPVGSVSVPTEAITIIKGQAFVDKVVDGRVTKLPVELGKSNAKYTEITSSTIQASDSIIVQGKEQVMEDQQVRAVLNE